MRARSVPGPTRRIASWMNLALTWRQLAMRKLFEDRLQRVEWDEWQFPVRLYPCVQGAARAIAIDPRIAFGRPVVRRRGISTAAITDRIDAGQTVRALADDHDLSPEDIEQAGLYARAA